MGCSVKSSPRPMRSSFASSDGRYDEDGAMHFDAVRVNCGMTTVIAAGPHSVGGPKKQKADKGASE